MANNNQVPTSVLPLAPLEYDPQHQNAMMRSLNFTLQQIQNPGHARMVDIVMTECPKKPVRDNGTSYPDGMVWNDSGFLKILPEGNPGNINADTVTANKVTTNLMYADTAYITDLNVNDVAAGSVVASTLYGAAITGGSLDVGSGAITGGYVNIGGAYYVNSTQVVASQQPAISNATGPTATTTGTANLTTGVVTATTSIDASSLVGTVNQILIILRNHGLIAT